MNSVRAFLAGLLFLSGLGWVAEDAHAKQAYLVTYGQGQEVWEWFGHNALWLQDPDQGLDHTFSFGYFDIDEAGFYLRFARGDMSYYGAAVSAEREFGFYRQANRSIRVQALNLTADEFDNLQALLTRAIEPYPQYYTYDYYQANCSTWLRDLLDQTLDGALSRQYQSETAKRSLRAHTRERTQHQPLASLGLMALLGPATDRPIQAWDEAFLPAVLADQVATIALDRGPLVVDDVWLYRGQQLQPPAVWLAGPWQLGAWGLMVAALMVWAFLFRQGLSMVIQTSVIIALSALGLVLVAMWALTTHEVAHANPLLLLLHPIWLGLLWFWPRGVQRISWWLSSAGVVAAMVVWSLFAVRPAIEVLVLVLPVVLTVLWVTRSAIASK